MTSTAKERSSPAVTYGPRVPGWASVSPLDVSPSCEYVVLPAPRSASPPPFHACIHNVREKLTKDFFFFFVSALSILRRVLPTFRTNITEPGASYASSRGTLVSAFLADPRGDSVLASATTALTADDTSYAGFNLLLLEPHSRLPTTGTDTVTTLAYDARLLTNDGGGGHIRARTLSDDECACGGISNGLDGQGGDAWPKVLQGRTALRSILDEGSADGPKIADADSHLAERLMELLTCVTASHRHVVIQLQYNGGCFCLHLIALLLAMVIGRCCCCMKLGRSASRVQPLDRLMSYEPENRLT